MPMSATGFIQRTLDALSVYYHKRVLILLLLGFSAGLPLMLVFSTLSFGCVKLVLIALQSVISAG